MIELKGAYEKRPIRFLQLVEQAGWRVKVYGIRFDPTGQAELPEAQVVALAQAAMLAQLPQPARTSSRYGVGFLIIHQGQDRNWLLLDWWYEQEILKQRLFWSPLAAPAKIAPAEADLLACTWELAVHGFERQAWLETVLANPAGPDLEAYLARRLNADV